MDTAVRALGASGSSFAQLCSGLGTALLAAANSRRGGPATGRRLVGAGSGD
ncbi:hypothetical protein [Streptomyces doebereineriae]|uniref:Uncharacterized protein n=1 Tax=Streptomyces doebereineriae TaxID=3075528 RepID=A0ABU2VJX2_9ACTN|nr:hypothetical protein [Streptomyces sp. DSM 41640]MDT0485431.1 hypothetical protein [Streptomyces sp. DSM 41640]